MKDDKEPPVILVVDDEPTARMTVEALLMPEGYELHFASSAIEMLEVVNSIKPDVILLDVMMPGMTGFEACRRLKADAKLRHVPIILLTALADVVNLVKGLEAGADEFLSKPVNGSELRARVRSMLRIKQQYDDLQAMVKVREELTHMTVHDLRTPLSTVGLYADLVRRHLLQPEKVESLADTISSQVNRLQGLVNEILIMAKNEGGQLALSQQPVDVCAFLQKVQCDHIASAELKDVSLVVESAENLPTVDLDVALFRRVIDNLLSNAFKFTPTGSRVVVTVAACADSDIPHLKFTVGDEGSGIPLEHRERVFDRFAVVEMKDQDVPQLGLGLAFCKMVVDAHGGNIFVESNEPQGARFVMCMPLNGEAPAAVPAQADPEQMII